MKICAFTGHRPKNFPWKYDESASDCVLLKKVLAEQIAALVDDGVTEFISGMAQGVDLWSSQIVLDIQKKKPALKLCCALPCEDQEIKWPTLAREQYHSILRQANDVIYVARKYSDRCMLNRNRWLVDHSSVLLAVYNGSYRNGTGATVRYARRQHRELIVIDPVSRQITYQ